MTGHLRAELLRIRKRPPAVIILIGIPVMAAILFVAGFVSIYEPGPFDPVTLRADALTYGYFEGTPPEDLEQALDDFLEQERQSHDQQVAYQAAVRATYAFPRSLVTVLGNAWMLFPALILLTAITIGDDFGNGTVRTALLAASDRRRLLTARFAALGSMAVLFVAALLLLGAVLPFAINVSARRLPAELPPIDVGALEVLAGGLLVAAAAVIAFSAMATLFVRSGALSLVAVLIYGAIEGALLVLLIRIPTFDTAYSDNIQWVLTAFPIRGLAELISVATRAASGFATYEGEFISRDLTPTQLPIASFVVLTILFGSIAFWRFGRMDIVE